MNELCLCVSLVTVDFTENENLNNLPYSCLNDTRILLYMLGRFYMLEEKITRLETAISKSEDYLHRSHSICSLQELEIERLKKETKELNKLVPRRALKIRAYLVHFIETLCCLKWKVFSEHI